MASTWKKWRLSRAPRASVGGVGGRETIAPMRFNNELHPAWMSLSGEGADFCPSARRSISRVRRLDACAGPVVPPIPPMRESRPIVTDTVVRRGARQATRHVCPIVRHAPARKRNARRASHDMIYYYNIITILYVYACVCVYIYICTCIYALYIYIYICIRI